MNNKWNSTSQSDLQCKFMQYMEFSWTTKPLKIIKWSKHISELSSR